MYMILYNVKLSETLALFWIAKPTALKKQSMFDWTPSRRKEKLFANIPKLQPWVKWLHLADVAALFWEKLFSADKIKARHEGVPNAFTQHALTWF